MQVGVINVTNMGNVTSENHATLSALGRANHVTSEWGNLHWGQ